jgi:hypothetical protein
MAKAALITIHGMGETKKDYADELIERVRDRLGSADAANVSFERVYYQGLLQDNQNELWDRCTQAQPLDWQWLRRFMLFSFSDAVGLEAGKDVQDSSYVLAQITIATALLAARNKMGESAPVVVIAQSLGGQVFSSYVYDAQRARDAAAGHGSFPVAGIWRAGRSSVEQALGPLSDEAYEYLQGSTACAFITTGCNIPIFIAAHARMSIRPIARPNVGFEWHNYFNPNDVLGWPLQPLSDGYKDLVRDHSVNAGNLATFWNPFSHTGYWTDDSVLDEVVSQLRRALAQQGTGQSAPVVLGPVSA